MSSDDLLLRRRNCKIIKEDGFQTIALISTTINSTCYVSMTFIGWNYCAEGSRLRLSSLQSLTILDP